ncbi:MAG: PASTA domain-containing protein, partial [Bacteroidota bacterium]|nr:PASTA domain-containing protein [Bacteroidota bacterium]
MKEFFKSKIFIVNAIAVFGITILLALFGMLFLWLYTDHGESVVIPDLKGRNSTEAAAILDELDLRFEIQDSVYSPETAPGTVLDQFPKPGQKVKENRTIFITLCAVSQEM